jgi:hypothetical protein
MDTGDLVIDPHVPQGTMGYTAENGKMMLREGV